MFIIFFSYGLIPYLHKKYYENVYFVKEIAIN